MSVLHVIPKFNGLLGSEYTASFYLDTPTPITPANVNEILPTITDWLQDMYDNLSPDVRDTITAVEYILRLVDLISGSETFYANGNWTFTGTGGTESAQGQSSATISLPVPGRKRPAQKRMIPFVEAAAGSGLIGAATLTRLTNFALEWLDGPNATVNFTFEPVLWSRKDIEAYSFSGVININDVLGTVGSRKPGVGS